MISWPEVVYYGVSNNGADQENSLLILSCQTPIRHLQSLTRKSDRASTAEIRWGSEG